jgi:hypothetical protein
MARADPNELVDLVVAIKARTDRAVLALVHDEDGRIGAQVWFLLSETELDDTGARGW